jgi:methanogenic corrinoid protein MtbC1
MGDDPMRDCGPFEVGGSAGTQANGGPPAGSIALPELEADAARYIHAPTLLHRRIAMLTRAIEQQVVPRLVLAARQDDSGGVPPCSRADVAELTRLLLLDDAEGAGALVAALRGRGVALERMFLELLTPAARRLGEMWEADTCSFTDVTVGLGRLHQILRDHAPEFVAEIPSAAPAGSPRTALLMPAPGEQHTFGLAMLAEFLVRAGWEVRDAAPADAADAARTVAAEWFAVVGISLGGRDRLRPLAGLIRAIRHASCNTSVGVMVGGPVFVAKPELARRVGADATAADARGAVTQAERLLDLLVVQR